MYALIEFKGKQYKAEKGASLAVDLLDEEPGTALLIDRVLLLSDSDPSGNSAVTVGTPYIAGATVAATIESHEKAKKIIVFKYKPKKDYRRKQGHRQKYTLLKIGEISGA